MKQLTVGFPARRVVHKRLRLWVVTFRAQVY